MNIAVTWNPSSIGSLLTRELLQRGINTHLYATLSQLTDNYHVQQCHGPRPGLSGLPGILATRLEFRAKRAIRRYDLELRNVAGDWNPDLGLKAANAVPYYHGMELLAGYVKPEKGFVTTPNLLGVAAPDTVLLPRCVNLDLFQRNHERRSSNSGNVIRVGHFWRRGSINADFAFRYFKGTDLLEAALRILRKRGVHVEYVDSLTPRRLMPEVLASLDILADQFVMGIYGLPAIEALLMGVPVLGCYKKEFCESRAVYDLLTRVEKDPEEIAKGILSASEASVGSTSEIREFHSPRHTVDVFLDTIKKWSLMPG